MTDIAFSSGYANRVRSELVRGNTDREFVVAMLSLTEPELQQLLEGFVMAVLAGEFVLEPVMNL